VITICFVHEINGIASETKAILSIFCGIYTDILGSKG
jgi:hypothetical protein